MSDLQLGTGSGGTPQPIIPPPGQQDVPSQTGSQQGVSTGQTAETDATDATVMTQVPVTSQDATSTSTAVVTTLPTDPSAPAITPPPLPVSTSDQAGANTFLTTALSPDSTTLMSTPSTDAPDPTDPHVQLSQSSQDYIATVAKQQGKDPADLQTQAKAAIETVRLSVINDPNLSDDTKKEILTLLITQSDLNGGPPPSPQAQARLNAARQEIAKNLEALGLKDQVTTEPITKPTSSQELLSNQIPSAILQVVAQLKDQPQYGDDYTDPKVIAKANADPEIVKIANATGQTPIAVYKEIQQVRQQVLDAVLNDPNNPIPEDVKTEIMKSLMSEGGVAVSPNAQKYLDDIRKKTNDALAQKGLPADSKAGSLNYASFAEEQTAAKEDAFESALAATAAKYGLTDKQQQELRNAYYLPSSNTALDGRLKGLLNDITNGQIPTKDSPNYTAQIDGSYSSAFITAMQNYKPPISAADQELIVHGQLTSLPANLQAIVAKISVTATAQVQAEFGLPISWKASVQTILPANISLSSASSINTLLDNADAEISAHMAIANAMPDGPEKTSYINFLKAVSACIATARQIMNSIMQSQADMATKLTKLMNAIEQAQLDLTALKDKEIKAKEHQKVHRKRTSILNRIMKAFTYVAIIVVAALVVAAATVATAGTATVIVAALVATAAAAYIAQDIASQAMGQDPSFLSQGMATMTTDLQAKLGARDGAICAMFIGAVVCVVAGWQNPALAFQLISDTGFCSNFGTACYPNDPEKAMYASLAMQMTVMVVGCVATLKSGDSLMMMKGLAVVQKAYKLSMTLVNVVALMTVLITGALTITQNVITIDNAKLDIEINKLKKQLAMAQTDADAMIAVLKKLIQTLLDSVNGMGDDLVQLSNLQSGMVSGASDVLNQLARAGRA